MVQQFKTGAIRDNDDGKEDYIETISWRAMKRYAQYMTSKKKKYGSGNFKKGIPIESYERSLLRHIQKYLENKYEDGTTEVNEDHLSAMVFNIFGIMHEQEEPVATKEEPTPYKEVICYNCGRIVDVETECLGNSCVFCDGDDDEQ